MILRRAFPHLLSGVIVLNDIKSVIFDESAVTGRFVLFRVSNKSTGETRHFVRGFDAATHKHLDVREEFWKEVDRNTFTVATAGGGFYSFDHEIRGLRLWSFSNNLGAVRDHELLLDILKLEENYAGLTIESGALGK